MSSRLRKFCGTILSLGLALIAVPLIGCTLPVLEKAECAAAREVVKRFYSFHFANETSLSADTLETREPFLTPNLIASLRQSIAPDQNTDYFTPPGDRPTSFRVSGCTSTSDDSVLVRVILLWKNDVESRQSEVQVEAVKAEKAWRINKVTN
ncbi:MAG: hypothetical protein ABR530_03165 [Pyrinomonadaceae bacterium]